MSNRLQNSEWSAWITVSKTVNFLRIGWTVIEKSPPERDQNEYVYAIWCLPEEAGDVFSGENVKTIEGYAVINLFEGASFSSFRDIKNHFVTAAEADIDDSIKQKRIRVSLKNQLI